MSKKPLGRSSQFERLVQNRLVAGEHAEVVIGDREYIIEGPCDCMPSGILCGSVGSVVWSSSSAWVRR